MDRKEILLVYDKECPVCDNYCRLVRIKEAVGDLNKNYLIFKARRVAHSLYPALKFCRNSLLKILGKTKINNLSRENNETF